MKAYPYDVELVIANDNTKAVRMETRRVYAYNVVDAITQAVVEASALAGSGDVKPVRVAPPLEVCVTELLNAFVPGAQS